MKASAHQVSIRRRLLVSLLGLTLLVWLAAVGLSYRDAREELNQLFDAQMAESAKVLLAQASHEAGELRDAERARERFEHTLEHPYEQQLHFRIRDRRGRVLYQSSSEVLPDDIGITKDGYADLTLHGARWRVLLLTDPEAELQIEMCQRYDVREGLAAAIARNMLLPIVVSLPLLAVLIWIATNRGIAPLARLAGEFRRRRPEDLRAVPVADVPQELVPLIASLNGLLDRLSERFEVERRFTADAAHELRTPLAAIRTQTQVAMAARNAPEREHALQQVTKAIDRTTHLIQQLLTLARVDRDAVIDTQDVDLEQLAGAVISELVPSALEKGIDVSLDGPQSAIVRGNAALLATLLRNLVENAIRYGRAGGEVRVEIEREPDHVSVHVIDNGPGIPSEDRERVFDRFHRVLGTRETGSGLGLSIVRRIAELHHAKISLREGDGGTGLAIEVRFDERDRM